MTTAKINVELKKIARLITLIHEHSEKTDELLAEPWVPQNHKAYTVAVTASTAAGKSTLIDKIITALRIDNLTVAVLAIDPSEEESGGAIFGDTMRMRRHYADDGVFMRSFGSRGAPAALTYALREIIRGAARFVDVVLVETAGAGQTDIRAKSYVDTLLMLPEPRGDIVTLMKAGVHNWAHVMAVNIRTDQDKKFLNLMESFARSIYHKNSWQPLVFEVNAETGLGVEKLVRNGLYKHKEFLEQNEKDQKSP